MREQAEVLETKFVETTKRAADLESENAILKLEIINLRQEIQRRDDVVKQQESHGQRLGDDKERILLAVCSESQTDDSLIASLNISQQSLMFHLEDWPMPDFVKYDKGWVSGLIALTKEGRAYLAKHGLLK